MALEDVRVVARADAAVGVGGKGLVEVLQRAVVVIDLAVALPDAEVRVGRVAGVEQLGIELDGLVVEIVLAEAVGLGQEVLGGHTDEPKPVTGPRTRYAACRGVRARSPRGPA